MESSSFAYPANAVLALVADYWHLIAGTFAVAALAQIWLFVRIWKSGKPVPGWLDPTTYQPLELAKKRQLNHNTIWLRFALPSPTMRLGLPIGQHIGFMAKGDDGKDVYRSYTPVSDDDQLGSVDFVIKASHRTGPYMDGRTATPAS